MRLILMGTGPFAVPSFHALADAGYDIVQVVTRPAVASLSKKAPLPSPVREWASKRMLPIADPPSINDSATIEWLNTLNADLMVVCDYGQILSKAALATTKLGGINLHGSLLPRHRGAAPVQWSILAGDQVSGISTIHMTPLLDGGPVLHQASTPVGPQENAGELEHRLSQLGVAVTLQSVSLLATQPSLNEGQSVGIPQDKSLTTKAPRLAKEDGELNFHYRVRHLDRLIRGLQPWPSTFAHLEFPDGKQLRVILPSAIPLELPKMPVGLTPGQLLYGQALEKLRAIEPRIAELPLWIAAIDGLLGIPSIQPSGKRLMSSDEFLRGYSRYDSIRIPCEPGTHRLLNQLSPIP